MSLDQAVHQEGRPILTFWEVILKLFGRKRSEAPNTSGDEVKPSVPFIIAEDNEAAIKIARAMPNYEAYITHTSCRYG